MFQQIKKKAFTLLEVLVALAILSTVFVALLQGQGDNIFILNTTKQRQLAQQHIRAKLYSIERGQETAFPGTGTFSPSHELAGQRWRLVMKNQEIFGIKLRKVDYSIELAKGSKKTRVQGTIYVE